MLTNYATAGNSLLSEIDQINTKKKNISVILLIKLCFMLWEEHMAHNVRFFEDVCYRIDGVSASPCMRFKLTANPMEQKVIILQKRAYFGN